MNDTESVFVSYSHQDGDFVDRLVADLRYSSVPATYDKWLLNVGDSIIEKIASSVSDAGSVIAVLSPASVESHWVKKELALGMTSEILSKSVKVLPAVIEECELPPMLADKLYADFIKGGYYWGLRQLLRVLKPSAEDDYESHFRRWEAMDEKCSGLESALESGEIESVRHWFDANASVLVLLFGRLWRFSAAVPKVTFGPNRDAVDYLVANGQSFSFDYQAIHLGQSSWSGVARNELVDLASCLHSFVLDCQENEEEFRRAACIRFAEDQIGPPSLTGHPRDWSRGFELHATILLGRREEYGGELNGLRQEIHGRSDGLVEVASYDRLMDAIKRGDERRH